MSDAQQPSAVRAHDALCAHAKVHRSPIGSDEKGWTDRWVCIDCGRLFVPFVEQPVGAPAACDALMSTVEAYVSWGKEAEWRRISGRAQEIIDEAKRARDQARARIAEQLAALVAKGEEGYEELRRTNERLGRELVEMDDRIALVDADGRFRKRLDDLDGKFRPVERTCDHAQCLHDAHGSMGVCAGTGTKPQRDYWMTLNDGWAACGICDRAARLDKDGNLCAHEARLRTTSTLASSGELPALGSDAILEMAAVQAEQVQPGSLGLTGVAGNIADRIRALKGQFRLAGTGAAPCGTCGGSGRKGPTELLPMGSPCSDCHGRGSGTLTARERAKRVVFGREDALAHAIEREITEALAADRGGR